jgi:hypothetical protein
MSIETIGISCLTHTLFETVFSVGENAKLVLSFWSPARGRKELHGSKFFGDCMSGSMGLEATELFGCIQSRVFEFLFI